MAESGTKAFANTHIADIYAKFRPAPPASLIRAVVQRVTQGQHKAGASGGDAAQVCVDMGCGSGQNTALLAPHFATVVGVDVSQPQLDMANRMQRDVGNVSFRVGSAEAMPFDAESVNLVTCSASVHWFNLDSFYQEVDRVLCPGGVLACYSYLGCTPICHGRSLRDTFLQIWHDLGAYWTQKHNLLLEEYATLPQLYPNDTHIGSSEGGFIVSSEDSMEGLVGYMASWSGLDKLRRKEGEEAAMTFLTKAKKRLLAAAGTEDEQVPITRQHKYFLRMWQKPSP
ncbi:uncharacterized protein LOC135095077 [Scylla paramamosain]|uniref:uncharacterized protein LOC135095077 n=1 Tax=Scylla paramamosain TaxID=85552 RepID=UPI003082A9A1